MKTKRQRIFVKPADARVIFQRGRGFDAYINFYKENLKRACTVREQLNSQAVCRCDGSNVYDTLTGIVVA